MSDAVVTESCETGFRDGEVAVPSDEDWYRVCLETDETWDPERQQPSSMIFALSSQDDGELSGTRSGKTTPEETYRHQTEDKLKAVAAVVAIPVKALTMNDLHLHDDSALLAGPPDTPIGHTWLDLKHLPTSRGNPAKRAREKVRSMLLDLATIAYQKPEPATADE